MNPFKTIYNGTKSFNTNGIADLKFTVKLYIWNYEFEWDYNIGRNCIIEKNELKDGQIVVPILSNIKDKNQ